MLVSIYLLTFTTLASASVVADEVIVVNQSTTLPTQTTPAAITNHDLDQQPAGLRVDAAELLQGLAGVQADSRANFAQDTRITLRGFGARSAFGVRGVVLQLDGIPLTMPDGQAQTSSILLDEPSSVQVIRGPLATVYGNSAGGVIQWWSERPLNHQLHIEAALGANATQRQLVQADVAIDRHAIRLVGARFRTNGPRPQNSAARDQLAARWYYNITDNLELTLRLDDNNAPLLEDPGSLSPADWRTQPTQTFAGAERFNTRKSIHHQQVSLSLADGQHWRVNLWQGWRNMEQYLPFPGTDIQSSGAVVDLHRQFTGIDASYRLRWATANPVHTTIGIHHASQADRRWGYTNELGYAGELRRNERGQVTQRASYMLTDWQPTSALTVLTGLRYSHIEFAVDDYFVVPGNPDDSGWQQQHAWSWSLGLNYQLSTAWNAFLSTGVGFETATLTEMAYNNTQTGLNTELGAATNRQWEAGLRWQQTTLRTQLVWFRIDTTDEIVVDQSIDGRTTYTNAGLTQRRGIEWELAWQLSPAWHWRVAATRLLADFDNGRRLPGVAERHAYSQLDWDYLPNQRLSLITEYRGDIVANDDQSVLAPSHALWHLNWQGELALGEWQLNPWLRWHNVTNKQYVGAVVVNQSSGRAFEPGVGREMQVGVQFNRRY